jgi:hypothetical protein
MASDKPRKPKAKASATEGGVSPKTNGVAHACVEPAVISTGGRDIVRPNPNNIAQSFQRAIEGVLMGEAEIQSAYRGLLDANRIHITSKGERIEVPDHNIRLATLKDIMDRAVGRAIERQQVVTTTQPMNLESLLERIAGSPVLRSTLMDILSRTPTQEEGA